MCGIFIFDGFILTMYKLAVANKLFVDKFLYTLYIKCQSNLDVLLACCVAEFEVFSFLNLLDFKLLAYYCHF